MKVDPLEQPPVGEIESTEAEELAGATKQLNPYSGGGGGSTFAHYVATLYVARMILGQGCLETDDLPVRQVHFQVAEHAVDDLLVVGQSGDDEIRVMIAARRAPNFVRSHSKTRALVASLVAEAEQTEGQDRTRIAVAVAGWTSAYDRLQELAVLSRENLMEEESFYRQIHTPGRRNQALRTRYKHLSDLIRDGRASAPSEAEVRQLTWRLLRRLWIIQFRVEVANERDWSDVSNDLERLVRSPYSGAYLRDKLFRLCAKWDLLGVEIDERVVRHHIVNILGEGTRSFNRLLATLDDAENFAHRSVRSTIGRATGNGLGTRVDRTDIAADLKRALAQAGTDGCALIVAGESGVGKSSLVLSTVREKIKEDPDNFDAIVINLRHLTDSTAEMRAAVREAINTSLKNSPAAIRLIVVDAADISLQRGKLYLEDLINEGHATGAGLVAVSASVAVEHVYGQIGNHYRTVHTFDVPPLSDSELEWVAREVAPLGGLLRNLPKRSLLRRLVVLDLLSRARPQIDGLLTGWTCLQIVWRGLVRQHENSEFGSPEGREEALLALAERELGLSGRPRSSVHSSVIDTLRRDHLIAPSDFYDPEPRFAHDEVRRYAVALVLVRSRAIARTLEDADVPRWAMPAAQLACQGWLQQPGVEPDASFRQVARDFAHLGARHGPRWADVPVEAALESPHAYEHLKVLPLNVSDNAVLGFDDIIRVAEQHQTLGNLLDIDRAEPVVRVLLQQENAWLHVESIFTFIAAWLHALIVAETPEGDATRHYLRAQLTSYWQQHYEPLATEHNSIDELPPVSRRFQRLRRPQRRQRGDLDYRLTNERLIELYAALGADIDMRVEEILREIAERAPGFLAPAVDSPLNARGISQHSIDLLQVLMERYYIDLETDSGGLREDGIREHWGRWSPIGPPFAAYWYGGFWQIFQRGNLARSASLLNNIVNHAVRYRVSEIKNSRWVEASDLDQYTYTMLISGEQRTYVGDSGVWNWYRGTAGGPYPCMSALQAMERILDLLLEAGAPISVIVRTLLMDCENLAVPALLLGVMIRHIEVSQNQIEPFLAEPIIWTFESGRIAHEHFGAMSPDSGELANSERRRMYLRDICMRMVLGAGEDQRVRLRVVGRLLAQRGESLGMGAEVEAWAANLDYDRYRFYRSGGQVVVEVEPPEHVARWQAQWQPGLDRTNSLLRLQNRYSAIHRLSGADYSEPTVDEIAADLILAEDLLGSPPPMASSDPRDSAAHVAAAAIEAAANSSAPITVPGMNFAVKLIVSIASAFADGEDCRDEGYYYALGADRGAAAALPLLLLPDLSRHLSSSGLAISDVQNAASALTRKSSEETRLYLARGCDRLWVSPCHGSPCLHHVALNWLMDTARSSEIGPWDSEGQSRTITRIDADLFDRLQQLADDSIDSAALDAAIRGFGAAAAGDNCVAEYATAKLLVLLQTQRRAMTAQDDEGYSVDHNQYQSLVAARALAQAALDVGAVFDHITDLRGNAHLLASFLQMYSAVGAESPELGSRVRATWPAIMDHCLTLSAGTPDPYSDSTWGDWAIAALMPRPRAWMDGLYNEIGSPPFDWVVAEDLIDVIPKWVQVASGRRKCVDDFISVLHTLSARRQVHLGLEWVRELCVVNGVVKVSASLILNEWLIGVRGAAEVNDRIPEWQSFVDSLVAAGNRSLAEYSR
ncbi:hypothetical protein [Nocardia sp. NPDC057353]|uniref:hypothetical protein n=1 Tax=Nocardia sp. NPDC057353 TaxID=3346104 RepID=UPI00362B6B84